MENLNRYINKVLGKMAIQFWPTYEKLTLQFTFYQSFLSVELKERFVL